MMHDFLALPLTPIQPWRDDAACSGSPEPQLWDTDVMDGVVREIRAEKAKEVCAACPVRDLCRAFGDIEDGGRSLVQLAPVIYGGETPRERLARRATTTEETS